MSDNERYAAILLEEMNGKFDLMLELMGVMDKRMDSFATKDYLTDLIQKQTVTNRAIKNMNIAVRDHENRITLLERT